MDFLSRIKTAYAAVTGEQIYSRYDMQRLAKFTRSKQGLRLTAQLLQQTDTLTKKDVGMWRQAWQMAINVDNPQRHGRRDTAPNPRPAPLCRSPYAPIPHFKPLSRLFFPPPSNLPPHTSGKTTNEKSDEKQPPRHLSSLSVQPNSTPRRSIFASN